MRLQSALRVGIWILHVFVLKVQSPKPGLECYQREPEREALVADDIPIKPEAGILQKVVV